MVGGGTGTNHFLLLNSKFNREGVLNLKNII